MDASPNFYFFSDYGYGNYKGIASILNAFFGGVFEIYYFDDATVYEVKVCTSAFFLNPL